MKSAGLGFLGGVAIGVLLAVFPTRAEPTAGLRAPLSIEGRNLPLRVLTRPFSNIYEAPDDASAMVRENVPALQPLYVYARPSSADMDLMEGWYEVGENRQGGVLGWMRAGDVMEWKQAMCLAYTHPDGRSPVLMFARRDPLAELAQSDPVQRAAAVEVLYRRIEAGEIPEDFPLVSVEPKRSVFLFIEDQFYLLPILRHEPIEIDGWEGRLLHLAAATTAQGGRGATTVQDTEYVRAALTATETPIDQLRDMTIDVVYVVDTTASMQPYINGTRQALQRVADQVAADAEIADHVRFGLWTFRDSMEIPGIEYLTRNWTPSLLPASGMAALMAEVEEAGVGSRGFPEDVFSGIVKSLTETAWSENSLRFVLLVGDAPGHPKGHAWNASGQGPEELRQLANDTQIRIQSVHIKNLRDARLPPYHELAERQFRTLAENPGSSTVAGASYVEVDAHDEAAFGKLSDDILAVLRETLEAARRRGDVSEILAAKPVSDLDDSVADAPVPVDQPSEARNVTLQMVRAALVDWIGRAEGVQAPRDIVAWVVDKDLRDPAVPSLEVRVLVNKNELDSLRTVLQEIMVAGRRGQIANENFFDALQATSATLSVTPEQIRNARTLAETGLIPEFMVGLPYRSRIMAMSQDDWNAWSRDQQDEFLNDLDAKIRYYASLHDEPGVWVRLNPGDDPDDFVHPVSLDMLP